MGGFKFPASATKHFAVFLLGLLAASALHAKTVGEFETPVRLVENYERPKIADSAIDGRRVKSLMFVGDTLDLSNQTFMPSRDGQQRTADIVFLARRIKIGPNTSFLMGGVFSPGSSENTRAGDVYIAAETITVDGVRTDGGGLGAPFSIQRDGARINPTGTTLFDGRQGNVHVFTNRVEYAPAYLDGLLKDISGGATGNVPVPVPLLKAIARSFSAANPVHGIASAGVPVMWSELTGSYQAWLRAESVQALAARALRLDVSKFDTVNSFPELLNALPSREVENWFIKSLWIGSGVAKSQLLNREYGLAASTVDSLKSLVSSAPPAVVAKPEVKASVEDLLEIEKTLLNNYVIERLNIPRPGAPPLTATVVRDQASLRVQVLPNILTTQFIQTEGGVRIGFADREGTNVRLRFLARLQTDPSVLEFVKTKFPGAKEVRETSDDVLFDTPNLQLTGLISQSITPTGGGEFSFDLRMPETSFIATMAELTQTYGKNVSIGWRRGGSPQTALSANLSLFRGDLSLVGASGKIRNPFAHSLDIDYFVDGDSIRVLGSPVRITAGQEISLNCAAFCSVPGPGLRHVLTSGDPFKYLLPASGSAVQTFSIENQISDDPARGGAFHSVHLDLTFAPGQGSPVQTMKGVVLGRQGTSGGRRVVHFLGPPNGSMTINGRAYWGTGQSYRDLKSHTVEAGIVLIDSSWLP